MQLVHARANTIFGVLTQLKCMTALSPDDPHGYGTLRCRALAITPFKGLGSSPQARAFCRHASTYFADEILPQSLVTLSFYAGDFRSLKWVTCLGHWPMSITTRRTPMITPL